MRKRSNELLKLKAPSYLNSLRRTGSHSTDPKPKLSRSQEGRTLVKSNSMFSTLSLTQYLMPSALDINGLTLSARHGVEENITKARRQIFALGSLGCFLGHPNPLSSRAMVEPASFRLSSMVQRTGPWMQLLLICLRDFKPRLDEEFSRFHSTLSVLVGLSWPSMKARVLKLKLSYLFRLISADPSEDSIASSTFRTLASQDVYGIGLVQQCLFLDSCLGTTATEKQRTLSF